MNYLKFKRYTCLKIAIVESYACVSSNVHKNPLRNLENAADTALFSRAYTAECVKVFQT